MNDISNASKTNRHKPFNSSTFTPIDKSKEKDIKHYQDSQFYNINKKYGEEVNNTEKSNSNKKEDKPINTIVNSDKKESPKKTIDSSNNENTITTSSSKNESTPSKDVSKTTLVENNNTKPIVITPKKELVQQPDTSLSSSSLVVKIAKNQKGLDNLGNTCFMNTCLQNLIHCTPFIERLLNLTVKPKKLTRDFINLCKTQASISARSSSPSEVKSSFGSNHSEYRGYRQHDTQEFCRLILEDISKELNTVKTIPPYREIKTEGKTRLQLNTEFDQMFRERENSIVVDTFYGQIENIFKCKCGYESFSFEKYLDLPIYLDKDDSKQELTKLIRKNFEKDSFEWGSKCEKCGKKTIHDKQSKISILPEILILSLQRINPRTRRKISSPVSFDDSIDLSSYVDKECVGSTKTRYNLYGIGNHSGSIDFGHYYAYIKLDGSWIEFNDSFVSACGEISHSSSGAYVLFYKREDVI